MAISRNQAIVSWILQIVAALILGQTLFFKFTGAPEAVALFVKLGAEPWGRYAVALGELTAVILLLVPRTIPLGALLTVALMVGAIGSHLTKLGIVVEDDGGLLFALAWITLACGAGVAAIRLRAWRKL